ncbi:MAG: DUF2147 domain-containing protein [Bacteroidia bacterium]|nr:DUF2147 domain-containing protein [Bacteroidia bacterium]
MFIRLIFISSILISSFSLFSQENKEELLGYYSAPGGESIFKFYKDGNNYFAKPIWMKRPERLDELNPDKSKRTRKILGSVLLWDFEYDGKNTWSKGHIYDANKGKTYKAKITRDKNGNLVLRGYIGVSLIGKSEYFTKVEYKE